MVGLLLLCLAAGAAGIDNSLSPHRELQSTGPSTAEGRILCDFYNANPICQYLLTNWCNGGDPCNGWRGIGCNTTGRVERVTAININNIGCSSLPASIGGLTGLASLNLESNKLAQLPSFLGDLTRLKSLSLQSNGLAQLPSSIGGLTGLNFMYLGGNALAQLPSFLGDSRG